jgi:hypothetical protein
MQNRGVLRYTEIQLEDIHNLKSYLKSTLTQIYLPHYQYSSQKYFKNDSDLKEKICLLHQFLTL